MFRGNQQLIAMRQTHTHTDRQMDIMTTRLNQPRSHSVKIWYLPVPVGALAETQVGATHRCHLILFTEPDFEIISQ